MRYVGSILLGLFGMGFLGGAIYTILCGVGAISRQIGIITDYRNPLAIDGFAILACLTIIVVVGSLLGCGVWYLGELINDAIQKIKEEG